MKSCKILRYGAVCGLAAWRPSAARSMTPKPSACANSRPPSTNFSFRRRAEPAQIQLYSNGRVRVEALNDIGGWASVDRSEFDGDRMVSVTFTENDSFRRMAKLRFVLDGGTRADTVCIKQYGVVPSLECPAPYKAIRGSVETFTQFEIDTNIPLGDFAVATAYVGPTRDWIRSVQPEQGMLVVDTKPNPGDDVCKAGRQPELRRRLGGDLLGQPLHHAGRQGRRVRPRGVVLPTCGRWRRPKARPSTRIF